MLVLLITTIKVFLATFSISSLEMTTETIGITIIIGNILKVAIEEVLSRLIIIYFSFP